VQELYFNKIIDRIEINDAIKFYKEKFIKPLIEKNLEYKDTDNVYINHHVNPENQTVRYYAELKNTGQVCFLKPIRISFVEYVYANYLELDTNTEWSWK